MLQRLVVRIKRWIRTSEVRSCAVPQGNGEVGGNPTNRRYSCLVGVMGDARRRGRELQDRQGRGGGGPFAPWGYVVFNKAQVPVYGF
ncbi:unnamed protein product, partial [Musa hybrid cultivar]